MCRYSTASKQGSTHTDTPSAVTGPTFAAVFLLKSYETQSQQSHRANKNTHIHKHSRQLSQQSTSFALQVGCSRQLGGISAHQRIFRLTHSQSHQHHKASTLSLCESFGSEDDVAICPTTSTSSASSSVFSCESIGDCGDHQKSGIFFHSAHRCGYRLEEQHASEHTGQLPLPRTDG